MLSGVCALSGRVIIALLSSYMFWLLHLNKRDGVAVPYWGTVEAVYAWNLFDMLQMEQNLLLISYWSVQALYRYVPLNDVSVNDGPHKRR
jgi:hypothetical protein